MSSIEITETDEVEFDIFDRPSFLARARKAVTAGVGAAAAAFTVSLGNALVDGFFDFGTETVPLVTATVGFGVLAFAAVWRIPNAE